MGQGLGAGWKVTAHGVTVPFHNTNPSHWESRLDSVQEEGKFDHSIGAWRGAGCFRSIPS